MSRKHIKTMNERFLMDDTKTKPKIAPPDKDIKKRPWRPVPTERPSEKEKTKPMGEYNEIIDLFFDELDKIKDTKEGRNMIKKIHDKYAK